MTSKKKREGEEKKRAVNGKYNIRRSDISLILWKAKDEAASRLRAIKRIRVQPGDSNEL